VPGCGSLDAVLASEANKYTGMLCGVTGMFAWTVYMPILS
jgi:hypothetical protein